MSEQQSVLLGLQADVRVQQIAGQEEFTARPSQKATVLTQHTSLLQTGEVRHEKIVATMMTGSNESIVGEAVQSALRFVDEVVLVDTGISDGTKEVVESIAKGKYVLVSFPWCQDFAAARNAALQFASDRGATWALTLDSDERMRFPPFEDRDDLLNALNSDPLVKTWMVACGDNSYSKERFIRVPTSLRWAVGRMRRWLVLRQTKGSC